MSTTRTHRPSNRPGTFNPCHTFGEAANTTDAVLHACGHCGGDKRTPRS